MKISLNANRLELLTGRMEKLNKRLVKQNFRAFSITDAESFSSLAAYKEVSTQDTVQMVRQDGPVIVITLQGPELVKHEKEIAYLGTISDKGGARSINSTDPTVSLFNMECRCDHCNQKRHRVVHHVFRADDEILMVGSACCKEFFGYDPLDIINAWTSIMELSFGEEGGYGSGSRSDYYSIIRTMIFAHEATNGWKGYTSTTVAEQRNIASTKNNVSDWLNFDPSYSRDPLKVAKYRQLIESWDHSKDEEMMAKVYDTYKDLEPTNDFEFNMISALFTDLAGKRVITYSIPAKLIGIAIYGIYKTFHVEAPKAERKPSDWVGTVGDKIGIDGKKKGTIEVKVTSVKDIDSAYGWVTLVLFEDENGNAYKTFTSSEAPEVGKSYGMYGTIKSHDEYKGFKSTNMTRVKFIAA